MLNVAGCAAILALTNPAFMAVEPFALLSLLIVCSREYSRNLSEQLFSTAFVIDKCERGFGCLNQESGNHAQRPSGADGGAPESPGSTAWNRLQDFSADPFTWLTTISLLSGVLLGSNVLLSFVAMGQIYLAALYGGTLLIGHGVVILGVVQRTRMPRETKLRWWLAYRQAGDRESALSEGRGRSAHSCARHP